MEMQNGHDKGFNCANCTRFVSYASYGTKNRNHCPYCLYSVHVDNIPGDRSSNCSGLMKPVGKLFKKDGEEMIVHECEKCGFKRKNRVAGDDSYELVEMLEVLNNL